MALLSPDLLPTTNQAGGWFREVDTVRQLQASLPDGYEIFHHIPLHDSRAGLDQHGEIDIVVLGPTGSLLLMEVKAGDVLIRDGSVIKVYSNKERDVSRQIGFQFGALMRRLKDAGLHAYVTTCLVLPDYRVGDAKVVSIPRDRIIDATEYEHLGARVREMLAAGWVCEDMAALRDFLRNDFRVTVDLSVMHDQIQRSVRALADGLATWVPRVASPSGVIRIQASAGSGKTQLALRLLEQAAISGKSALYTCFNRTLADFVRSVAPTRAQVSNFHELCVDYYRRRHGEPDFSAPSIFGTVTDSYIADSASFPASLDLLIIDEGQDFEPEWLQSLIAQLAPQGQLYLLEDDDQRLYDRKEFDLPDAVTIQSPDNFRTPRAICNVINAFGLASRPVRSLCPHSGEMPSFQTYETDAELLAATAQAVERLLAQGFRLQDIAVLTGRGHSKSIVLGAERIGAHATSCFTGRYDRNGDPVWSAGDLLVESIYRYKGRSAPAVVLTEIDFAELSEVERRKLFVGFTRAQMAMEVVISRRAEECLGARLGSVV